MWERFSGNTRVDSQEAERTNVPAARLARNVIECYLVVVKSHPADCLKIRREAKVGYLAGFANPAHSWLWNLERMQVFEGVKRSQELSNLQEKGLGEECGRLLVPVLGPASRNNQPQQMSIPSFLHLQKHAGSRSGLRFTGLLILLNNSNLKPDEAKKYNYIA